MASLLVIGGDKLGAIPSHLKDVGFHEIIHIDGRKVQMVKREIPDNIDLILVLTDFINHNLAKKIKDKANKKDVPICFSRRSWCAIYQSLTTNEIACDQCPFLKVNPSNNH
ncbi:DUF2325 domain-containing protein [Evansella sp. AB-P1]|uniref:DUF2325 domain-containing protein n=1 Tax=Evansella sp. AB-P1 TaxID=3037653 RepID=UPI00241E5C8A|nr:DUF2325 domain-containing protein [Evansella sp. AB-P1]MDG5786060.1 DUF2325 domain-containing protein [Evansella sp. AB-P1]